MDMQGSRQLAVTQQQAWEALNDPEVLKACIPGCDKVEPTGENQYAIGMAVKVGPVSAKFTGKIKLEDVLPPNSYTLRFEGQGGAAGFGKGTRKVRCAAGRRRGCELSYTRTRRWAARSRRSASASSTASRARWPRTSSKRFDAEMQRWRTPSGPSTACC
jgi:carbon monoxide dehydrogenase subunit G